MKKFLSTIITAFLIFGLAFSVEAARKVVAVMPLENIYGSNTENVAEIMTEELMVALQSCGKYSVVERTQMATILREQGFQNIAADQDTAVEIGKLLGANYSLIGKVTMATLEKNPTSRIVDGILEKIAGSKHNESGMDLNSARIFVHELKGKVSVDVRLVDNETGEIVFAKSFTGTKSGNNPESALYGACKVAADNFLREITADLMGRIADISGNEIYIDQGIESGLRTGDELLIVRETSPIIVNEKIVGMKTVEIGKAKVISVSEDYSVCRVISTEKGATVMKGDVVKRG